MIKRTSGGAVAIVATALALTGCSGFTGGGNTTSEGTLTFTTWASESEKAAFEQLVSDFEAANDGVQVELNVVPYDQMFSNIDAQLSAGNAPDLFRVDYGNLGVYSSQDQLLDVSPYFTDDEISAFTPAMWEAVSYDGTPYGVPHQTDVSALVVNTEMLAAAGVTDLPTTQADAWTWDEFADVAAKLKTSLPADVYPFVYNWQLGGTPRWLSWLFQADGALLADDGVTPAIDSAAGSETVDFTRSFFEKGWVPPTSSVKATTYADAFFTEESVAMAFAGSFVVPDIDNLAGFEWTALPMPVNERGATDLGGNAMVASKETDQPDLAASFLKFMVDAENMTTFCAATNELPTRTDIDPASIDFAVRPDVMPVFVEQASTIEPSDVAQLTSPYLAPIAVSMQDQLEAAFVNGQSTADTISNLTAAIREATGS
ncbi:carbohydrate ABC transporter substrate-binding protein (CUT1 family) [Microbacterium sp. AG1240]|uniref:ABC transporter substrate-binding protein n=1 Tax=Microbacterium sp. AG1240 TaxID=2183992 RepID=UPI000EAE6E29|nr:sugar ABC transporter substrate-binding protein [Microbacterium sp. AG1240]RKT36055.1 carbohydrate ABC transporter substrate-binding protein (CUT1 family) [Microbacterium sp. AG1240]